VSDPTETPVSPELDRLFAPQRNSDVLNGSVTPGGGVDRVRRTSISETVARCSAHIIGTGTDNALLFFAAAFNTGGWGGSILEGDKSWNKQYPLHAPESPRSP